MTIATPTIHATDALERPDWLPTERWPFTLHRYDQRAGGRDPLAIHYADEGEGPVLVFVRTWHRGEVAR